MYPARRDEHGRNGDGYNHVAGRSRNKSKLDGGMQSDTHTHDRDTSELLSLETHVFGVVGFYRLGIFNRFLMR